MATSAFGTMPGLSWRSDLDVANKLFGTHYAKIGDRSVYPSRTGRGFLYNLLSDAGNAFMAGANRVRAQNIERPIQQRQQDIQNKLATLDRNSPEYLKLLRESVASPYNTDVFRDILKDEVSGFDTRSHQSAQRAQAEKHHSEKLNWEKRKFYDQFAQKVFLQDDEQLFKSEESDKDRTFKLGLQNDQQAWQSGESIEDRALKINLQDDQQAFNAAESALERALKNNLLNTRLSHDDRMKQRDLIYQASENYKKRAQEIKMAGVNAGYTRAENYALFLEDIYKSGVDFSEESALSAQDAQEARDLATHETTLDERLKTFEQNLRKGDFILQPGDKIDQYLPPNVHIPDESKYETYPDGTIDYTRPKLVGYDPTSRRAGEWDFTTGNFVEKDKATTVPKHIYEDEKAKTPAAQIKKGARTIYDSTEILVKTQKVRDLIGQLPDSAFNAFGQITGAYLSSASGRQFKTQLDTLMASLVEAQRKQDEAAGEGQKGVFAKDDSERLERKAGALTLGEAGLDQMIGELDYIDSKYGTLGNDALLVPSDDDSTMYLYNQTKYDIVDMADDALAAGKNPVDVIYNRANNLSHRNYGQSYLKEFESIIRANIVAALRARNFLINDDGTPVQVRP